MQMNRNIKLPDHVIAEAKRMLKDASRVYVILGNRRYRVVDCLGGNEHALDEKVVAEMRDYDFYTDEQRAENYINSRHQFPEWYTGKRDYALLERMLDAVEYDDKTDTLSMPVGRIVDGDFVWNGERETACGH